MDDVAALFRGDAELSGRRAAQLHARQARPHHVVGVPAVDHRVAEPVGHEGWLLVALHAADRLHRRHAVQRFLDQLYRDLALLDVADVAVVQRVEMRDVHQVLDEQRVVRRHVHRVEHVRLPFPAGELGRRRRHRSAAERRVAHPDPGEAVLLDDGKWTKFCARRDRQVELRRDAHAVARGVVAEPVVRALEHAVGEDFAFRERHALVHAAIVERGELAAGGAPHQDRPAADLQAFGLVHRKLLRASGDVPGVLHEGIEGHRLTPWGMVVRGLDLLS